MAGLKSDDLVTGILKGLRRNLPPCGALVVAYSGGTDSHVLLHVLSQQAAAIAPPLRAVHVNHRLQPQSDVWERHCRSVCADLCVPFAAASIEMSPPAGESIEAWARRQRYRLLRQLAGDDAVLVTAHHARDQAETFLLRALRGAGAEGLSGIAEAGTVEGLRVVRPMLHIGKDAIDGYAASHGLHAIDDPSNRSSTHDRNFLRQVIMPRLRARWPAVDEVWSRNAMQLRRDAALLLELTGAVLDRLQRDGTLDLAGLSKEPSELQRAVVRLWLSRRGVAPPAQSELEQLLAQAFGAANDRNPVVRLGDFEVRRFQHRLHLLPVLPVLVPEFHAAWDPRTRLALPSGELRGIERMGDGIAIDRLGGAAIEVRLRRGGERCRPRRGACRQKLKHLFQQLSVPPWERPLVPLLFVEGELVAIANYLIADEYRAGPTEPGLLPQWVQQASDQRQS